MPFGSLGGFGTEGVGRFEMCGGNGGEVRTSFKYLGRDVVKFGFELFKQRLDLSKIGQ